MGCPSHCVLEDNLIFSICTHDPDTGVLTDADGDPSYRVYEDETAVAILTGTMSKLDDANTTGFYTETIACTAANGFERGKTYTVYIEATVDGDTGGIAFSFKIMEILSVNTTQLVGETITTDAADNWDNFWFNNDAVSTERVSELPTTADLFTTASAVDVGRIAGSTVSTADAQIGVNIIEISSAAVSTATAQIGVNVIELASGSATAMVIGTGTVYDNIDHGTLMQYVQAYVIGDFKVTGASTNEIVYDDWSGTTFMQHVITTASRVWSS